MPGNRPAKKTPGGKGFSPLPCDFVESMLEDRLVVLATADIPVEVDLEAGDAVVEDEAAEDSCLESLRELLLTSMEQNACPSDCVRQSYPKGQQSSPQVERVLERDVVRTAESGKAVTLYF